MVNKKEHPKQNILLFDGICNLCNRTVQFIIKNDPDNRFKFAALQYVKSHQLLQAYQLVNNQTDTVVYIKDGEVFLKSSAALELMKELGWPWKILYTFMIIPKPIRDFVYDQIAKRRYRFFGKRDTCMIPTIEIKDKFLT